LSLRTNQFNSTTKRRSESEVKQLFAQANTHIWTVTAQDRFGDYGLVGVMVGKEKENHLNIDSFMLSCRALGRGIEHKMLSALGHAALESNCAYINLDFIATAKNFPVFNFFEEIGSRFKLEFNHQLVYRIPSEIAAKIDFNPTQKTISSGSESKNGHQNNLPKIKNFPLGNAAISKIANQFQTATQILSAIKETEKNRSRSPGKLVPPNNETEQKLKEIWQKTLNIAEIGITDNFFQLGGDSLLSVSLFVEIEDAFGKHLPLTVLIESPTIEKMAEQIDAQKTGGKLKHLVPLKPEGHQRPLFCMHAAGGNVLFYRDLANELKAGQPVYGLQARGVADKSETAHDNIAEMAAEYLKEMRTVQPEGPYQLCGSSFGGLIAFEMACQLMTNGEKVSLLTLFDTYAPGYVKKKPNAFPLEDKFLSVFEKVNRFREQIGLIETPREKLEFFGKQWQKLRLRAKRKKAWQKNQFDLEYAKATGRELPPNIRRNHLAIEHALKTYSPPVYSGKITLFRAAIQPAGVIFEPTLGWKDFTTQEITIREISGSHGAVTVYPFAKNLAKALTPFLAEKQKPGAKFAFA
jgi:thioesterase domain-containing protein/acyl carrier protein